MRRLAVDITTLRRLPTLPAVAVRLLNCFGDPETPLSRVAEIVQFDPAVTAKLLRAASSVGMGVAQPVTDLRRALNILGIKKVTSLALCFSLCEGSMTPGPFSKLYRKVWLRAVVQAQASGDLAAMIAPGRQAEFFSAGLLSEIGPLAILKTRPNEFPEFLAGEEADPTNYASGSELSAAILAHWQMPESFSEAVRNRWRSLEELTHLPVESDLLLSHAAALSAATAEYFCQPQKGMALVRIHELADVLFGLKQDAVQSFVERVQGHVMENCDLLETDISTWGQPSEILAVAMEQLSQLAVTTLESTIEQGLAQQVNQENQRLRRRVEDLLHRSITDVLTRLFNRAHFDDQLPQWIRNARGCQGTVGLLFLDLDRFKSINDTHGHAVGDMVLKQVASAVKRTTRESDFVARYGGEELVILVANPTIGSLQGLGERIRAEVASELVTTATGVVRPTVSVGGSIVDPVHSLEAASELVHSADQAMYLAKRNGRNRVEVWSVLPHGHQESAVAEEMGWPMFSSN
ncbi:sensor domain-containing diguanylate cyclase [Caulifigura coniformis]|uniref:sensor domain-containing diguanylate cyclase n=1 Tax=Caulifigura coniformis TaxID=2527983 RepID=UPI00119C990F|nr:GGDEF domain-containing protein [Caulifigura coniformis]